MPVLDGLAATKAIRALVDDRARIPIIAMTANVGRDDVQRCREAGMSDFIAKPIDPDNFYAVIARHAGRVPVASG
jgi:CheY-like chemotaxis protein